MAQNIIEISDKQMVLGLVETSKSRPVYIFKYANTCKYGQRILNNLENLNINIYTSITYNRAYKENQGLPVDFTTKANHLCKFIGAIIGVKHNTPQLIILENGKAQEYWNCVAIGKKLNLIQSGEIHKKVEQYEASYKKRKSP